MTIYMATFIFEKAEYDDEFYALDKKIEDIATQTLGFIGMESFTDINSGRLLNHYYWSERSGMEALIHHELHLEAKKKSARWIRGYQVIISVVEAAYNNQQLTHPLSHYSIRKDVE